MRLLSDIPLLSRHVSVRIGLVGGAPSQLLPKHIPELHLLHHVLLEVQGVQDHHVLIRTQTIALRKLLVLKLLQVEFLF